MTKTDEAKIRDIVRKHLDAAWEEMQEAGLCDQIHWVEDMEHTLAGQIASVYSIAAATRTAVRDETLEECDCEEGEQ